MIFPFMSEKLVEPMYMAVVTCYKGPTFKGMERLQAMINMENENVYHQKTKIVFRLLNEDLPGSTKDGAIFLYSTDSVRLSCFLLKLVNDKLFLEYETPVSTIELARITNVWPVDVKTLQEFAGRKNGMENNTK